MNIPHESRLEKHALHCALAALAALPAVLLCFAIAWWTPLYSNPDEILHLDACRYFSLHNWPPPLGSNLVVYDPAGWSRVYSGELVYWIYGKIGHLLGPLLPLREPPRLYRLLNVAVFALTLLALGMRRYARCALARPLAVTMILLPQVIYIYGYANSDASSLAASLLLFGEASIAAATAPRLWRARRIAWLGVLTGLVLASKENFVLAAILPAALVGQSLWRARRDSLRALPRARWAASAALWLLPVLAIAAPLRVVYPLTQSTHYSRALVQLREIKAAPEFRPSNPTYGNFSLDRKGYTYWRVLTERPWLRLNFQSFYGVFGGMDIFAPRWIYKAALGAAIVLLLLNLRGLLGRAAPGGECGWRRLTSGEQLCFMLAPLVILLNLAASLHNSLTYDFQPQGRYLFSSFVPIVLLLAGAARLQTATSRRVLVGVCALLYPLCLGTVYLILLRPVL